MLPSTGYFKAIICPFYENGCCDRPYCHFKHLRRDDSTSSAASLPACQAQTPETSQNETTTTTTTSSNVKQTDKIHHLVNEAMKKLLETQEVEDTKAMTDKIVAQVVEQLKPSVAFDSRPSYSSVGTEKTISTISTMGKHTGVPSCVTKPVSACVYNPTPISELKKRHINVPVYMPTRENRVAAKRKSTSETIAKPWLGMLRESTNSETMTYKPTAIVNTAQELEKKSSTTYVPTLLRSDNSSSNSYDDGNSNDYSGKVKEAYYPKSKKRREEYVPKKVKAPLKSIHQLDDTIHDEFIPEFHTIDEILTSSKTTTNITQERTIVIDENSVETNEIEAKFSDDEEEEEVEEDEDDDVEEIMEDSTLTKEVQSNKIVDKTEDEALDDGKENESNEATKKDIKNTKKSRNSTTLEKSHGNDEKTSKSSSGRSKEKSRRNSTVDAIGEIREKDKKKERRDSSKSDGKKDELADSRKKEHKSSGKNHDKRKKDVNDKQDCKEKQRHEGSSTRDKSRGESSNKDKDRNKNSHSSDVKSSLSSSNKSKDTTRSRRDKVPSTKSVDVKSREKSSRHESSSKHTSSSSKNKKNESHRSTEKKRDSRSSSHKSSKTRDKKSKNRKESSSETSFVENDDRSNSPFESNFVNEELMETSDSDHDVEEECLKIFQEYEPTEHPKGVTTRETRKNEPEDNEDVGKKRVAHPSAAESIVRAHGPSLPAKKIKNPHQRMYERWRSMKEAAEEKAAERKAASVTKRTIPVETEKSSQSQQIPYEQDTTGNCGNTMSKAAACDAQVNGNGASKIRIAHVPYAMALAMKKKKVTESKAAMEARAFAALEAKTAAQTSKGSRVAHIPQVVPQLTAPEPLQVTTQKFPITVRQYYVNLMHVICVQIYTNGEDAAQRALREELACHDRCKALTVYKNSCMLATHRLRKEAEQGMNGEDSLPSASGMVSHNAVLAGKSKGSWSVEKTKKSVMDYRGVLYGRLKKWISTEQQLRDNGFPRSHPDGPKGHAKVYAPNTRNQSIISKVPNERYCCRCNKPFMVNKHGLPVQQENCIYHWGRKFKTRGESKYMCCQQYGFASGCSDAKNHVWEYVDYDNLRGYVKTLPKDIAAEEQGVYALDCEMSYTTQGLELTRVTVINDNCNTIYETLVMPENPILDYNTRFSGITEENMKGVTTTLLDVQATLLTMFSEKTILIGHSLESDFKALKLIHDTVVDTSMMFPHKNGPPQKRALRNLCSEYLRKIIQNEVGGHDSTEDAVACMDLVHWKVKEEAKLQ